MNCSLYRLQFMFYIYSSLFPTSKSSIRSTLNYTVKDKVPINIKKKKTDEFSEQVSLAGMFQICKK